MMNSKQKIALALASLHFTLVLLGACHKNLSPRYWWGRGLSFYSAYSGAGSGYGFFAPGVATSLRAHFQLKNKEGRTLETRLQTGSSHEFDLRVSNIINSFFDEISDVDSRRALAASMAGKVLGRHPHYQNVKVNLESYDNPSLIEFGSGKRGKWVPFYEVEFAIQKENLGE